MVEEKNTMNKHKYTILVVEDEVFNFKYLEELLTEKGHKVLLAINGEQAIDMFREESSIDIILMDLKLPILNGIDATKEILKVRSIPVIAQTAYTFGEEQKMAQEAGCIGYLSKPIEPNKLLNMVNDIFTDSSI